MEAAVMRRLLSILLFWATLFPMVAPALTTGAMGQSTLPACCRRGGEHHCMMSPEERAFLLRTLEGAVRFSAPPEECPYRQHAVVAAHLQIYAPGAVATHSAFLLRAPSVVAQAECLRRISFDRSRQKRGPPVLLS
jgi:hypothetical protein